MYTSIMAWEADKKGWPRSIGDLRWEIRRLHDDVKLLCKDPDWRVIRDKLAEAERLIEAKLNTVEPK